MAQPGWQYGVLVVSLQVLHFVLPCLGHEELSSEELGTIIVFVTTLAFELLAKVVVAAQYIN